jgi:hypothetical protein
VITIEPTTDEDYIKSVFLNPKIYAKISDDSCSDQSKLDFHAAMSIPGFFLKALVDGVEAGCFWLVDKGESCEVHTALLDNCRGRTAINLAKEGIRWVFSHTEKKSITSYAWSDSPSVAWFCRAVGMTQQNTEKWPATRGGKSVNITYFKINRGDI